MKTINAKNIICLLLLFISGGSLLAQGWEKVYDFVENSDEGRDVLLTNDGGAIIVGYVENYLSTDVAVLRVDREGDVLWFNALGNQATNEFGEAILKTVDNRIFIGGTRDKGAFDKQQLLLMEIDEDGQVLNQTEEGGAGIEMLTDLKTASVGGLIFVGKSRNTSDPIDNTENAIIGYADEDLNVLSFIIADTLDNTANAVVETQDGNFVIIGTAQNPATGNSRDIYLTKVELDGDPVWDEPLYIGGNDVDQGLDILEAPNGDLIICGSTRSFSPGPSADLYVNRLDSEGTPVWDEPLVIGGVNAEIARSLAPTPDGHYVVTGTREVSASNIDVYLVKFDANDGTPIFERTFGDEKMLEEGFGLAVDPQGGMYVTGYSMEPIKFIPNVFVLKATPEGNLISNHLTGRVVFDENDNCFPETGEEGFANWILRAKNLNTQQQFVGTTDEDGHYDVLIDTGTYEFNLIPPNTLWVPCDPDTVVSTQSFFDTFTIDFPVQRSADCPVLNVSVTTPFLRRCVENRYTVKYCNQGSITATDASLEVILDGELDYLETVNSPSSPTINGDTLFYELGDVAPQECGSFQILVQHNCSGTVIGQTHCVEARVFPDSFCLPPDPSWDGSSLAVEEECENGIAKFRIRNKGSQSFTQQMGQQINFIVIEDDLILLQEPVPNLGVGEDSIVFETPTGVTAATYRIIVEQTPNHPGNSNPTVALEGCVENQGDPFSIGYYTMFPENDGDPFISISCEENISSFASNVKRGHPKGFGDSSYIESTDFLEYTITFTNVGTDTAFYVVIRDTLPEELDAISISSFSGSPKDPVVTLFGGGIVKAVFDDVALPPAQAGDSLNATGHLSFNIFQNPDNVSGTKIRNRAAITFDYNDPIITPNTLHTVVDSLEEVIPVSVLPVQLENGFDIKVYPNPFAETAIFEISTAYNIPNSSASQNRLNLYDATGRLVRQQTFGGNQCIFRRKGLNSGFYFYTVTINNEVAGAGKVLIR